MSLSKATGAIIRAFLVDVEPMTFEELLHEISISFGIPPNVIRNRVQEALVFGVRWSWIVKVGERFTLPKLSNYCQCLQESIDIVLQEDRNSANLDEESNDESGYSSD